MIGTYLRRLRRSIGRRAVGGDAGPAIAPSDGSGTTAGAAAPPPSPRLTERRDPEEVDRLVRLTFEALLGRQPEPDTLLAYREGFANGTTFQGLVDDVLKSDEYAAAEARSWRLRATTPTSPEGEPWEAADGEDPAAILALLETRLVGIGCRLNLGLWEGAVDDTDPGHRRRMRGLLVTMSMLDRL